MLFLMFSVVYIYTKSFLLLGQKKFVKLPDFLCLYKTTLYIITTQDMRPLIFYIYQSMREANVSARSTLRQLLQVDMSYVLRVAGQLPDFIYKWNPNISI